MGSITDYSTSKCGYLITLCMQETEENHYKRFFIPCENPSLPSELIDGLIKPLVDELGGNYKLHGLRVTTVQVIEPPAGEPPKMYELKRVYV